MATLYHYWFLRAPRSVFPDDLKELFIRNNEELGLVLARIPEEDTYLTASSRNSVVADLFDIKQAYELDGLSYCLRDFVLIDNNKVGAIIDCMSMLLRDFKDNPSRIARILGCHESYISERVSEFSRCDYEFFDDENHPGTSFDYLLVYLDSVGSFLRNALERGHSVVYVNFIDLSDGNQG